MKKLSLGLSIIFFSIIASIFYAPLLITSEGVTNEGAHSMKPAGTSEIYKNAEVALRAAREKRDALNEIKGTMSKEEFNKKYSVTYSTLLETIVNIGTSLEYYNNVQKALDAEGSEDEDYQKRLLKENKKNENDLLKQTLQLQEAINDANQLLTTSFEAPVQKTPIAETDLLELEKQPSLSPEQLKEQEAKEDVALQKLLNPKWYQKLTTTKTARTARLKKLNQLAASMIELVQARAEQLHQTITISLNNSDLSTLHDILNTPIPDDVMLARNAAVRNFTKQILYDNGFKDNDFKGKMDWSVILKSEIQALTTQWKVVVSEIKQIDPKSTLPVTLPVTESR